MKTTIIYLISIVSLINAQSTIVRAPIYKIQNTRNNNINKRDQFTTSLYNDFSSQYIINIGIGTPSQNFTVTLDTGSADLWVPGSNCPTTECPIGYFNSSTSSTFKSLNQPFSLQYGLGSVNGTYVTDTVTVAGASIQNQQFGLASSTDSILTTPSMSGDTRKTGGVTANGIFGLGFPKLTAAASQIGVSYNPFVFNLASQGIINNPIFSIYLNNADSTGWVGEIIFGGVDNSKFQGNISYLSVSSLTPKSTTFTNGKRSQLPDNSSKYYWMVGAKGFAVADSSNDSNNLKFNFPNIGGYVLDTGTTLTYFPANIVKQIVNQIVSDHIYTLDESLGGYVVNCNSVSSSISIQLLMANSMNDNAVVLSVPMSNLLIPLDSSITGKSNFCLFGIAPTSSTGLGDNIYLIGESILRSAYLVFDMGNNRIGLAAATGVAGSVNGVSSLGTKTPIYNSISLISGLISLLYYLVF